MNDTQRLPRYDLYWYDDEAVRACLDDDVTALESENAELKARLADLDAQEPSWYIVESGDGDDDAMFRDRAVAETYAAGLESEVEDRIIISKLYAQPKRSILYGEYVQMPPVLTTEMRKIIAQNSTWESPDYLWELLIDAAPKPDQ